MAGGPPSSVDGYGEFGGGAGTPSSVEYGGEGSGASYWEERFGPRSDFDPSAFAPSYTRADKGEEGHAREAMGVREQEKSRYN